MRLGLCLEHSYKLSIPCKDSLSISDVIKGICKHFGIKVPKSTLRCSILKKTLVCFLVQNLN